MRSFRMLTATAAMICGTALAASSATAQTMSDNYDSALNMFTVNSPPYNSLYTTKNALIVEAPGFPIIDEFSIPATDRSIPNGLFPASQYGSSCNTGMNIVNDPGGRPIYATSPPFNVAGYTPAKLIRACKVTNAPIVDASFISSQIQARGWYYTLVFPATNSNNNRAYIVWSSDQNRYLSSERMHTGMWYPQYVGYARIKGVTWQNQFPVDAAGTFVAGLPSALRATTLRLSAPGRIQSIGVTIAASYATILADDWLSQSDTPVEDPKPKDPDPVVEPPVVVEPPPVKITFPVIPGQTGAGTPGAINIGTVSDGAAAGTATSGSTGSSTPLPFDYEAFCNSPSKDGSPRSPLWVQNCLRKQQ